MLIRLAFLAEIGSDDESFEIAASLDVPRLPAIGEMVTLPETVCEDVALQRPSQFVERRFRVCVIDHHWHSIAEPDVSVYVESVVKR